MESKYQCISLQLIWCYDACGRWQIIAIFLYPIKCQFTDINIISMLTSILAFAHFMRYNRRKWKPLIDCNGLAQRHCVLNVCNIQMIFHDSCLPKVRPVNVVYTTMPSVSVVAIAIAMEIWVASFWRCTVGLIIALKIINELWWHIYTANIK